MTRTKLALMAVAAFVGMLFVGLSISTNSQLPMVILALAAFCVAGYWGKDYVVLTKRMIGARTAQLERHLKVRDEPPAAAPPAQEADAAAPGKENS